MRYLIAILSDFKVPEKPLKNPTPLSLRIALIMRHSRIN